MKGVLLAAAFVLTAAGAQAQSNLPKIAKDTDYAAARKTLLAQGYAPERLTGAVACEKDDPRCFPETFSCAGTGLGACLHIWKRANMIIEVSTLGEQPIVDRIRCRTGC